MVKLRSTRAHRYNTRALQAGDEFEASPRDAKILKALKRAEEAPTAPSPRRGRPPRVAEPEPAPEPPQAQEEASYEDMTRDELLMLAEERGIDMPSGYVSKSELIELVRASA